MIRIVENDGVVEKRMEDKNRRRDPEKGGVHIVQCASDHGSGAGNTCAEWMCNCILPHAAEGGRGAATETRTRIFKMGMSGVSVVLLVGERVFLSRWCGCSIIGGCLMDPLLMPHPGERLYNIY